MACFINCNFSHNRFFLKSVNRVPVCTCISTYPRNDGEELKKKYFIFYLTILFGKAADIYHNYAPIKKNVYFSDWQHQKQEIHNSIV